MRERANTYMKHAQNLVFVSFLKKHVRREKVHVVSKKEFQKERDKTLWLQKKRKYLQKLFCQGFKFCLLAIMVCALPCFACACVCSEFCCPDTQSCCVDPLRLPTFSSERSLWIVLVCPPGSSHPRHAGTLILRVSRPF